MCPVDHPANAHALMFRFPRFDFTSCKVISKVNDSSDNINNNNKKPTDSSDTLDYKTTLSYVHFR